MNEAWIIGSAVVIGIAFLIFVWTAYRARKREDSELETTPVYAGVNWKATTPIVVDESVPPRTPAPYYDDFPISPNANFKPTHHAAKPKKVAPKKTAPKTVPPKPKPRSHHAKTN